MNANLADLKEQHQAALLELKALEQFNHTRLLNRKRSTVLKGRKGRCD